MKISQRVKSIKTIKDTNYSASVHTFGYDLLGRVTSLDGPWTDDTLSFVYDDAACSVTRTSPGGVTETTTGDGFGRLASVANPLGIFTNSYDDTTAALGMLTGVTHTGANAGFNTGFTYHGAEFDRALKTITSTKPGGDAIAQHTYGYAPLGNIATWKREAMLANPSGTTRSFEWSSTYDFASQLTAVTEKSLAGTLQEVWDYTYDLAGNIASVQSTSGISSSAALTKRSHNALNQITTLGGGGATTIRGTLSEPGVVSIGLTGQGDKPARMLDGNRFESELPLQVGNNSLVVSALDANRNRSTYTYNVDVASMSPQSFDYDTDGNLTFDGVRGYDWDSQSRLTRVTWAPGKTTDFKYNALGQRCERIDTDGSTITNSYYLFDGINLVCRYSGGTAIANLDRKYLSQGEQRKNGSTWASYYYTRDHLGSVREVMNSNGTLAARYDFDPYGKRLTQYQSATYTGGCDLGFTGHLTLPSPVTGQAELALTHFRIYDPALGRWLSADPIGEVGGMNLYAYCYGNPLNLMDPDGQWPSSAFLSGFFSWDEDSTKALNAGVMATADGWIPFADPFQDSGGYNPCQSGVGFSKAAGAFARDAAIMATGLPLAGSKRFVPPGAASGTNAARLVFSRVTKFLPNGGRLSRGVRTPVGTPFVNFAWRKSPSVAGILGRYWPYYAGGGGAISDAMDLNSSRDCP